MRWHKVIPGGLDSVVIAPPLGEDAPAAVALLANRADARLEPLLIKLGPGSEEPHFRGIRDDRGQLIVVMTHNTDIADGWEREGEDNEFFHLFSVDAYPVGINIVLYSMTH